MSKMYAEKCDLSKEQMENVITTPEQVTAEWLTGALRNAVPSSVAG
jgi:hypothetical protein